jgi:hypothetical protein
MKTVVHIVDSQVVAQDVPDDWIECSVLGEYRPPEEFRKPGETTQTRTNCTRAYEMPLEEWEHHKKVKLSLQQEIKKKTNELWQEKQNSVAGVSIDAMIAMLSSLQETNPNARIVVRLTGESELCGPEVAQVHGYKNVWEIC